MNGSPCLIWIVGLVVLVTSLAGTTLRTRRSTGELRQQLRWLAYAAAATGIGLVVFTVIALIDPRIPRSGSRPHNAAGDRSRSS